MMPQIKSRRTLRLLMLILTYKQYRVLIDPNFSTRCSICNNLNVGIYLFMSQIVLYELHSLSIDYHVVEFARFQLTRGRSIQPVSSCGL